MDFVTAARPAAGAHEQVVSVSIRDCSSSEKMRRSVEKSASFPVPTSSGAVRPSQ